jgi:hypothetical protein
MVRGQNPGKFNQASSSKPLTPPTTIPKQEFGYPPPSPYPHQQLQQSFDQSQLSPTSNNLSPLHSGLSPNPNTNYQSSHPSFSTSYQPVNPNPAQLPALVAHAPGSPGAAAAAQQHARGMKRPSALGDGDGWTNDQYGNVYTTGKVGINTNDPQEALSVQGNVSPLFPFYPPTQKQTINQFHDDIAYTSDRRYTETK